MKPTKVKDKKKSSGLRNGIVITGVILIVCIVIYQINEEGIFLDQFPTDYQTVGPLTIDKKKYVLSENIFAYMSLHPLEDGTVSFYTPTGELFYAVDFNGSRSPDPQFYFRPMLENERDLCTKNDIVGIWTAEITGKTLTADQKNLTTVPKELKFEIVDKMPFGHEEHWLRNVCGPEPTP
tara:strand:- start:438 stop:977 length:540 start_codon:yes stop_codon:yes gene_type:complete